MLIFAILLLLYSEQQRGNTMYRIYPTLLNTFSLFLNEKTNSQGEVMVKLEDLLDQINRVRKPTTEAQQKGINFEKAVTTGDLENLFEESVIEKTRALLPAKYKTQVYSEAIYKNCQIYGYVDILGGNKAFDLKSTRAYSPNRFALNHQNLYLLGLQKWGVTSLDYIITDFTEVYQESYSLNSYDFSPLFKEIDLFVDFLQEHRKLIRDKKIFGISSKGDENQLSLF